MHNYYNTSGAVHKIRAFGAGGGGWGGVSLSPAFTLSAPRHPSPASPQSPPETLLAEQTLEITESSTPFGDTDIETRVLHSSSEQATLVDSP